MGANEEGFWGFTELKAVGDQRSAPFLKRYEDNPVLSAEDVPYKAGLVFNCSVIVEDGRYTMVFRNDYFYGEPKLAHPDDTNFGIAHSDDGIAWQVGEKPIFEYRTDDIQRVYDPRITVLEGRYYMTCVAASNDLGPRAATFVSDDLESFELIDLSLPNGRNSLLFPEKIGGKYYRLERPFWGDVIDSYANEFDRWLGPLFHTWITTSPDLLHWGDPRLLIHVDQMPYANVKNGPGAPPIKTPAGWLLLVHGVDFDPARGKNGWEPVWKQRYHAGVALVDLEDPTRLLGLGQAPLITPETPYETEGGFRNNVVFPMAGILEEDGQVKIYYGAADTRVCLATAHVDDLLAMCEPV